LRASAHTISSSPATINTVQAIDNPCSRALFDIR
jgi:hypothetical protein